ncbi:N-formylglutamate deformylase [Ruegeria pomeroyi]|nr:N-formylglutamate deformylase [Ruegeria pomeroyi]
MTPVEVIRGDGPVVLGMPHGGTFVPDAIHARLNPRGQGLSDTDWHIDRLYAGLLPGASVVKSTVHRYVIDANRDPAGVSLYPGQNTTTLCPTTDFDGHDIWLPGQAPDADEIAERRATYHAPYHAALTEALVRARDRHGVAVLYDCHSIRSDIPFLFAGTLPIFNIGTNNGTTCAPEIEVATLETCRAADPDQTVLNGRFKGGWTTRHYGRPETGQHAIQMETAQRAYMDEAAPWTYRTERADRLRPVLAEILTQLETLALSGRLSSPRGA